jgi:hypothetical protein
MSGDSASLGQKLGGDHDTVMVSLCYAMTHDRLLRCICAEPVCATLSYCPILNDAEAKPEPDFSNTLLVPCDLAGSGRRQMDGNVRISPVFGTFGRT